MRDLAADATYLYVVVFKDFTALAACAKDQDICFYAFVVFKFNAYLAIFQVRPALIFVVK